MGAGALAGAAALMVALWSGSAAGSCEPAVSHLAPGTGLPGRVHVATFDSCEQGMPDPNTGTVEFNETVCEVARNLFQSQPGVRVTFWCERWRGD